MKKEITVCDSCDKEVETNSKSSVRWSADYGSSSAEYDLCLDCHREMIPFMMGEVESLERLPVEAENIIYHSRGMVRQVRWHELEPFLERLENMTRDDEVALYGMQNIRRIIVGIKQLAERVSKYDLRNHKGDIIKAVTEGHSAVSDILDFEVRKTEHETGLKYFEPTSEEQAEARAQARQNIDEPEVDGQEEVDLS